MVDILLLMKTKSETEVNKSPGGLDAHLGFRNLPCQKLEQSTVKLFWI